MLHAAAMKPATRAESSTQSAVIPPTRALNIVPIFRRMFYPLNQTTYHKPTLALSVKLSVKAWKDGRKLWRLKPNSL
jgi:hypothetical protein